jgi:hypothetical protein
LALKKETLAGLAAKYTYTVDGIEYPRSLDALKQFSSRNHAEVAVRRQALLGEVDVEAAHLWVSSKANRIAHRQKLLEGLERLLADEALDPRLVPRMTREYNALLRAVAEEKGELRTQVEVRSLMPLGNRLVMTDDGQFHEVAAE